MEDPGLKSSPQPEVAMLRQQLDALGHLVVSVLILLVVVSGTFTIFLLRQWQSTRKDLAGYRPGANATISAYNTAGAARMDGFIGKITDYGKTHPDFRPILAKYGIPQATNAPAAPPKK